MLTGPAARAASKAPHPGRPSYSSSEGMKVLTWFDDTSIHYKSHQFAGFFRGRLGRRLLEDDLEGGVKELLDADGCQ